MANMNTDIHSKKKKLVKINWNKTFEFELNEYGQLIFPFSRRVVDINLSRSIIQQQQQQSSATITTSQELRVNKQIDNPVENKNNLANNDKNQYDYDDYWDLLNVAYDNDDNEMKEINGERDGDDGLDRGQAKLKMLLIGMELDDKRWWE